MATESTSSTGFYLYCTGQIETCEMPQAENLYCKYQYDYSADWKFLQGIDNGMSQIARISNTNQNFIWNYPIEGTFKSQNPHGWPKLIISCYTVNFWGTDVVQGYGWIHIPTTPGTHVRYVRLYTPISTSLCAQFINTLAGQPSEFFDSKFVSQNAGREVTRVQSQGVVKIVFNIMLKNFNAYGYSNTQKALNTSHPLSNK